MDAGRGHPRRVRFIVVPAMVCGVWGRPELWAPRIRPVPR
ncbi:MAG: hypothetical protein AVDCRST_MAG02-4645 [uncultured Rubrobacteraceae bacterium]|uniref:Uncharacterized protein n=1 Tax=uncultured Rubrobacteraceae bacterium TaxID=349277 RepID=A0A6J4RUU5_9ACTN|nr:MAG: hypothetical protein AVDCRST_MAG02-4645 [uncultured Rubrobacteraceae bacterium]